MRKMLTFGLLAGIISCTPAKKPAPETTPTAAPDDGAKEVTLADVGLDASAMDTSIDPCVDFYRYACGGWLDNTKIPGDQARWSRGFSEIHERNRATLRTILEEAAASPGEDPIKQKIGSFYSACMDTEAIEKKGLSGIEPLIKEAREAMDGKGIEAAISALHRHQVWVVFNLAAEQDLKDATKMVAWLDQGGLGLPDRDYYLKKDKKAIRDAYQKHVEKMMRLAGSSKAEAAKAASDVLHVETELARVSMPRVERRDPYNIYHPMTVPELKKIAGAFWWEAYLERMGEKNLSSMVVMTPDFFKGFDALLEKIRRQQWANYFEWHVIRDAARSDALPQAFIDETFRMRAQLTGQKKQQARWKRCVSATDSALGELVGQIYVKQEFPGQSKTDAEKMVKGISAAFERNLADLDWMDDATRGRASEKREMMVYKIGYPNKWKTYPFEVSSTNHLANLEASAQYELKRNLNKIGKPVDREEWFMTPATVNAYYNPLLNEMVFPAGILQPPFYDVDSDVPVNLGGMGMIVGHELTHGFDDSGAKFAGDGNLRNWWEEEVGKKFEAKTGCVAEQYSKYEPLPNVKLNGKLTLGENIADIGGIKLAYSAYRKLRADAEPKLVADGFNEDQQFFLGVAQAWCSKSTDRYKKLLVQTDPHSPPRFRVNGSLTNTPAFAKAFECKEGTPMRPKDICEVW